MIPRHHSPKTVATPDEPTVPVDAGPMIDHYATDLDFSYGPGDLLSITLNEDDVMREADDRFTVLYGNGEVCTLFRAGLHWMSRRERTWQTPPEPFKPAEESR